MVLYQRNNIEFRKNTALNYAEFYRAKGFLLNEILHTNKHIFSASAREILLQYFSVATDWLTDIESQFISLGRDMTDDEHSYLVSTFHALDTRVQHIIKNNPQDFDSNFVKIWIDLRSNGAKHIDSVLTLLHGADMSTVFARLCDFTSGFMNHILFNLHEVDSRLSDIPDAQEFLYVDRLDLSIMQAANVCSPIERLNTYKDHNLVKSYGVIIKHHIDVRYANLTRERSAMYKKLISHFDNFHIIYL